MKESLSIVIIEPFYAASHKLWLDGLIENSRHEMIKLTLPGRHWKWRMHGGAIELADQFLKLDIEVDWIIATDMLDFALFLSLIGEKGVQPKKAIYFHENQLVYPWSPEDMDKKVGRDKHYGFINYTSALVADKVLFNSTYHKESFIYELDRFLRIFPDNRGLENVGKIQQKSHVLPIGMDLRSVKDEIREGSATILWNHRWEFDKNPELFFNTLFKLKSEGVSFRLVVLGESYQNEPKIFKEAQEVLKDEIIHFGYAEDREKYLELMAMSDIVPVTSNQDFFGISAVEAVAANCYPIFPDRLAFPEHVGEEYLFETNEEFYTKLKHVIQNIEAIRKADYTQMVKRYDWSALIDTYDDLLIQ